MRPVNVDPVVDVPTIRNQLHDFLQELLQVVRGDMSRKYERILVRRDLDQVSSATKVRVYVQPLLNQRHNRGNL